jgi:hypothetical protein
MITNETEGKLKYVLGEISKTKYTEKPLVEIINHSSFEFEKHFNNHVFPNLYNLTLSITPDVFTKNYGMIKLYADIIKTRINECSELLIDKIKILPDYNKLQMINSKIYTIVTEWDEINQLQQTLLDNLQELKQSVDVQSIGLIARTIMDKLARIVFDENKHRPLKKEINVSNGMFKNQLHSYIDTVLSGEKNVEFRKFAASSIDFVKSSIDIMNVTTHKLDAQKHLAEVCVVSTISAVSIVNLIRQLE